MKNERQKYSGRAEIEYYLFYLSFGIRAGVRNDVWSKIHMNGEITCMHVYVCIEETNESVPNEHVLRVYKIQDRSA